MIVGEPIAKIIYLAITVIALGINGINDLRERKTITLVFLIASAIGIFTSGHPVICTAISVSALFLPDFSFLGIGAGDLEAVALTVSCLWGDSLYAIFFGCIAGIVFWLIKGHKKTCSIPFVFCLFVGALTAILYLNIFYR